MDHLRSLAAAVAANPGDRHTRLVLADALEEASRVEEAEILRQPGFFMIVSSELALLHDVPTPLLWIVPNRAIATWRDVGSLNQVIVMPDFPLPLCCSTDYSHPSHHPHYFHPEQGWYCLVCAEKWTQHHGEPFTRPYP